MGINIRKCKAKFAVERHVFITFAYRPAIVHSGSCLSGSVTQVIHCVPDFIIK